MDHELDQLGERIAEQAAHLDAATHRLLTDLREFDARGGWRAQGAVSCAQWLAWRVGWDLVTARDHMRVACKLAEFPTIDDSLRRGEVSYSKVRALLRAATPANETLLLDHARLMTASQLEKLCRKYALVQRHGQDLHPQVDEQRRHVRRRDTEDGMVKIEAVLHPEEAELVWAMLNHAAAQLARESGPATRSDSAESCGTGRSQASSMASLVSSAPDTCRDAHACLAGSAATRRNTLGPIDDSAESCEAAAPLQALGAATNDDSAESCEAATPLQSLGAAKLDDSTVSCETAAPLLNLGTAEFDDSAESCEAAAPLLNLGTAEFDDSAESSGTRRSHVALRASLTPVMPDSDLDAVPCLASGAAQPRNTSRPIGDSAESDDVASRSLLDRLLDGRRARRCGSGRMGSARNVVRSGRCSAQACRRRRRSRRRSRSRSRSRSAPSARGE